MLRTVHYTVSCDFMNLVSPYDTANPSVEWLVKCPETLSTLHTKWSSNSFRIVLFISLQSLDRLGLRGNVREETVGILLQSFLQEALVGSSGMGRYVHSSMLSIQHFLRQATLFTLHSQWSSDSFRIVLAPLDLYSSRILTDNVVVFDLT